MTGTDDLQACLTLVRAPGLGARAGITLLQAFGSASSVLTAPAGELVRLGLGEEARAWLRNPDPAVLKLDLGWLAAPDHHLVCWGSSAYPALLAQTNDPPLALFVAGDPALLATPALAIVGSRNPTPAGKETAESFAAYLASNGLTIVSGLAEGIDTAAHLGALETGTTIAVCGTGLDEVYPRKNARLAARIAEQGALVSELPTGTPARPANFPQRNRIISGLAAGTLVVEAALRSGSLITARLAGEQGREVFAIPGSIHNPLAKGCHHLIRQGAKLVDDAGHILEELAPLLGIPASGHAPSAGASAPAVTDAPLDDEYEKLLDCMEYTPLPVDQLVRRSGLTPDAVSSMLLIMELRGIVESAPGGRYAKRPART